ncbi:MAG: alpha-2-macroglobulin, partial [Prevotella sp.]|nr:alpha-2-macroglobulin [Prevotella sp.]
YNRNNGTQVNTLTTDGRGEAQFKWEERRPSEIYVYTEKDDASPEQWISGGYSFYNNKTTQNVYNVLTDRKLYRPGQTAHAAVIAYQSLAHRDAKVNAGEKLTLTLRNANHEVVEEKEVRTDEFGKASADFVLPTSGLTGQFSIQAKNSSAYFSVEEYKRPTFQVEFDEVTEKYQDGDTVTVVGHVKSFAGVPVQGAQVKYNVVRRRALWWWRSGPESDKTLVTDTLTTDDEGRFTVQVPMQMPDAGRNANTYAPRYYNFVVEADATDAAGESHHGETSLPLSDKATAFTISMPAKIEADSVARVTFSYLNNAGQPIPGDVIYKVTKEQDNKVTVEQTAKAVPANEPFEMRFNTLKSGRYTLEGVCGEDTVKQEFVVFSMKDKHPAVETHDWFYASAGEFPADGRPIYVQMGSSDKDQHIVYTLFTGDKVLESGVIDQSNAITTRQFTYKEEYGDGVLFTCAWVREGRLYTHLAAMRKPLPDKRLNLSWKTFRDRLTPGQKEEWTLHVDKVTKEQGDKVTNGASVLAVLFDKSLDEIREHSWPFSLNLWRNLPATNWQGRRVADISLYGEQPYKSLIERALTFTHFDDEMFDFSPRVVFDYSNVRVRGARPMMMAKSASVNATAVQEVLVTADALPEAPIGALDVKGEDEALVGSIAGLAKGDAGEGGKAAESTQMRENLNETAFFYPQLVTDENGDVTMKFTLPESITTWRFMALATDKEVRYGTLESEVVAKKDVMIQPNVPRFMRQGDKGQLSARIFNTGEKAVKGTALIELVDPETEKVVYSQSRPFSVEAGKTASVSFDVDASSPRLADQSLLVCRVSASSNGFSDGEQHYLPILPNRELVINTVPFTQNGPGTKTIDLTTIAGKGQSDLTVEYTNNPAWLMIQTLPTVAKTSENNAISQAAAFYANSLAAHLLHLSPRIKSTIELWKREAGSETSLMSSLEKNQELKTMVLDETPWVSEARHESEQKQLLSDYFDENSVSYRLENNLAQLRKLQNSDGSWSWWPGMPGSLYMTVAVSKMMVRLTAMTGDNNRQAADMLSNAYSFMGRQIIKEVEEMKKQEKKGAKNVRPSETAIDWLYLTTIDGRKLSADVAAAKTYLVNRLSKQTKEFTIYGKAYSAIILGHNGYEQKAKEYLQSIREYTVYKEEMGRYFDTRKAYYSWFDYKIPTEVAAIEAIRLLQPADTKTVEEMQRWLLQEKRTQSWDTPLNAVDAVYAFMKNNMETIGNPGEP